MVPGIRRYQIQVRYWGLVIPCPSNELGFATHGVQTTEYGDLAQSCGFELIEVQVPNRKRTLSDDASLDRTGPQIPNYLCTNSKAPSNLKKSRSTLVRCLPCVPRDAKHPIATFSKPSLTSNNQTSMLIIEHQV